MEAVDSRPRSLVGRAGNEVIVPFLNFKEMHFPTVKSLNLYYKPMLAVNR